MASFGLVLESRTAEPIIDSPARKYFAGSQLNFSEYV
jgi:hypothetical protein